MFFSWERAESAVGGWQGEWSGQAHRMDVTAEMNKGRRKGRETEKRIENSNSGRRRIEKRDGRDQDTRKIDITTAREIDAGKMQVLCSG